MTEWMDQDQQQDEQPGNSIGNLPFCNIADRTQSNNEPMERFSRGRIFQGNGQKLRASIHKVNPV
jgi:hypothetical protein